MNNYFCSSQSTVMSSTDKFSEALSISLFTQKGYTPIAPKILWPAEYLVDVFGEELKKRLFLTTTLDGVEYALRPDFTVPVAITFMESGQMSAKYSYCGTVFRQREDGQSGEFIQTGVEDFGSTDFAAKDAEILALAIELCEAQIQTQSLQANSVPSSSGLTRGSTLNQVKMDPPHKGEDEGTNNLSIQMGDAGLFAVVLNALKCPLYTAVKLNQDLGRIERLIEDLKPQSRKPMPDKELMKLLDLIESQPIENAIEILSTRLAGYNHDQIPINGFEPNGNRTAEDIVKRVHANKRDAGVILSSQQIIAIQAYVQIECALSDALEQLKTFAAAHTLDITSALTQFEARIAAFEEVGIDTSKITFSGSFGRRLNYYRGFMFNITLPHNVPDKPLAGGGRYDGLLTMLGHSTPTPAVGFAVWNERFQESRGVS